MLTAMFLLGMPCVLSWMVVFIMAENHKPNSKDPPMIVWVPLLLILMLTTVGLFMTLMVWGVMEINK